MNKIDKLTEEQQRKLTEFRERMFAAATSTATDRDKAQSAIALIVAPVLVTYEIHWCQSPQEASSLYASLSDSLRASLYASLSDSLYASLRASLYASLSDSLSASLRASLSASLRDSLRASLSASLRDSLRDSLSASLRASLSASLRDSLWDSLWDSYWTAFYAGPAVVGLVEYSPEMRQRLDAFVEFAGSAFALWILPGHVVVLEKPTRVVVTDGGLVDIGWGRAGE